MARPAWPAPMTMVWVRGVVDTGTGSLREIRLGPAASLPAGPSAEGSTGVDRDVDRDAVGQHVEHGRPLAGLLDDGGQLLGVVAAEAEAHLHLLVAVADVLRQTEEAE